MPSLTLVNDAPSLTPCVHRKLWAIATALAFKTNLSVERLLQLLSLQARHELKTLAELAESLDLSQERADALIGAQGALDQEPALDSFHLLPIHHGSVIAPSGELDLNTAGFLQASLSVACVGEIPLMLDLSALSFADVAGTRPLLEIARCRALCSVPFVVTGTPSIIAQLKRLQGPADAMVIVDTTRDASAYLMLAANELVGSGPSPSRQRS